MKYSKGTASSQLELKDVILRSCLQRSYETSINKPVHNPLHLATTPFGQISASSWNEAFKEHNINATLANRHYLMENLQGLTICQC